MRRGKPADIATVDINLDKSGTASNFEINAGVWRQPGSSHLHICGPGKMAVTKDLAVSLFHFNYSKLRPFCLHVEGVQPRRR